MPARYDAIKANLLKKGVPSKQAKTSAARIYQKTRRQGEPELNAYVARERKARKK